VNLGVYGADLSYAAMFDQKQVTMEYFASAQNLAKQMGVDGALTNGDHRTPRPQSGKPRFIAENHF
jgi:hypothetical protein